MRYVRLRRGTLNCSVPQCSAFQCQVARHDATRRTHLVCPPICPVARLAGWLDSWLSGCLAAWRPRALEAWSAGWLAQVLKVYIVASGGPNPGPTSQNLTPNPSIKKHLGTSKIIMSFIIYLSLSLHMYM